MWKSIIIVLTSRNVIWTRKNNSLVIYKWNNREEHTLNKCQNGLPSSTPTDRTAFLQVSYHCVIATRLHSLAAPVLTARLSPPVYRCLLCFWRNSVCAISGCCGQLRRKRKERLAVHLSAGKRPQKEKNKRKVSGNSTRVAFSVPLVFMFCSFRFHLFSVSPEFPSSWDEHTLINLIKAFSCFYRGNLISWCPNGGPGPLEVQKFKSQNQKNNKLGRGLVFIQGSKVVCLWRRSDCRRVQIEKLVFYSADVRYFNNFYLKIKSWNIFNTS